MEPSRPAIRHLFDEFEFPKRDGYYGCSHCLFSTTRKIDWFHHMKSMHDKQYDALVRQERAVSQRRHSNSVHLTTTHSLAETNPTEVKLTNEEFHQALDILLVQYKNGQITCQEYKAAIDDLEAKRP